MQHQLCYWQLQLSQRAEYQTQIRSTRSVLQSKHRRMCQAHKWHHIQARDCKACHPWHAQLSCARAAATLPTLSQRLS
jgi:hypothetical protein